MLEKRTYGIVCIECKYPFDINSVLLEKDAQLEHLRSRVAATGELPDSARCPREECKSANSVNPGKLIFRDVKFWQPESGQSAE